MLKLFGSAGVSPAFLRGADGGLPAGRRRHENVRSFLNQMNDKLVIGFAMRNAGWDTIHLICKPEI